MDTQARPKTRALQIVICSLGIHFQTISNVPSFHVLQIFSCRALPSLAPPVHVEYCPGHGAVTSTRFFFSFEPKSPSSLQPRHCPSALRFNCSEIPSTRSLCGDNPRAGNEENCLDALGDSNKTAFMYRRDKAAFPSSSGLGWAVLGTEIPSGLWGIFVCLVAVAAVGCSESQREECFAPDCLCCLMLFNAKCWK